MPVVGYEPPEGFQRCDIRGHSALPTDHRPQPLPQFRKRVVHAPLELDLHGLQLCLHTLSDRLPSHGEPSVPGFAANMRKPQEVERLRFPFTPLLPVERSRHPPVRLFRQVA
jgi:hypothetical protein